MSTFSRHRRKRLRDFKKRLLSNNGPDRHIGAWQIIDIHEIPEIIGENLDLTPSFGILQEFDFYCTNQKDWYLLRLRKTEKENYFISKSASNEAIIYLIAELNFERITDEFIGKILKRFEKYGIPKYRRKSINLKLTI